MTLLLIYFDNNSQPRATPSISFERFSPTDLIQETETNEYLCIGYHQPSVSSYFGGCAAISGRKGRAVKDEHRHDHNITRRSGIANAAAGNWQTSETFKTTIMQTRTNA